MKPDSTTPGVGPRRAASSVPTAEPVDGRSADHATVRGHTGGRPRSPYALVGLIGAAALLIGGGLFAVRALSSSGLKSVPIPAPDGVPEGAAPVTSPEQGTTAPVTSAPSATSAPDAGDNSAPHDGLTTAAQTRPAEFMSADYTWTAYETASPEAVALRFDPNDRYAIGTTDGPDGMDVPALYGQTDNGWQQIETLETDRFAIVGDTVYAVNDPAEDAEDTNQTLRAYDVAADTWNDVPLPDEAGQLPADIDSLTLTTGIDVGSAQGTLVAAVQGQYELDSQTLAALDASQASIGVDPDGSPTVVTIDTECAQRVSDSLNESDSAIDDEASAFAECEQPADPAQFGLTPAELALTGTRAVSYWNLIGGAWQQVELPDDGSFDSRLYPDGIVETYADSGVGGEGATPISRFYALDGNGSVKALYDGRSFLEKSWPEPHSGSADERALVGAQSFLLSQALTATDWSATNLETLGDGPGWGAYEISADQAVETAGGGVLVLATVRPNVPTEPTELTSADYTIRFEPGAYDPIITDNATGQQVYDLMLDTESGQLELRRWNDAGDLETVATFDARVEDVPALNLSSTSAVLASPDGLRFGTVDADALIALVENPPSSHLELNKVHENGGRIVVRGTFVDREGTYVGPSYVFVGTAN